jgi:hypothetical protein
MMARMVVLGLGVLGASASALAGEPPETTAAAAATSPRAADSKPAAPPSAEDVAKRLGVSVPELKRLRQLGFADSEIATQVIENKRTARQVITEREVINELAGSLAQVNVRVYKLSASEQSAERERAMKAALNKVRRERKTTREELRRIVAGTSLFTPEEVKRYLGIGLFDTDNLRRVVGTSVFGEE